VNIIVLYCIVFRQTRGEEEEESRRRHKGLAGCSGSVLDPVTSQRAYRHPRVLHQVGKVGWACCECSLRVAEPDVTEIALTALVCGAPRAVKHVFQPPQARSEQ